MLKILVAVAIAALPPIKIWQITWIADQLWSQRVTTYYVHSEYDSGAGLPDGSNSRPYLTIAAVDAVMGNDDTIVIGGEFREQWTLNHSGVTVRKFTASELANVSGATSERWIMRGDVVSTSWSSDATHTNTFVASTNAASAEPASVVINWDDNVWSDGRHVGHLQEASSAANCDATAGTWFWETAGTPRLIVNPPSGVTLNDETVAWCRTGIGLALTADNCTITDGDFYLWCDSASSSGYSIRGAGVSGCTIGRCRAWDTGYHGFGYAAGKCSSNKIIGCEVTGGTWSCDSYFVFFSNSGALASCEARNCTANLSPLLLYGATEASESFSDYIADPAGSADPDQVGFTQHTGSSQTISASGVVIRRCVVNKLSVSNAGYKNSAIVNGEDGLEPTDKWDYTDYSIQVIDCDFTADYITCGQGGAADVFKSSFAFVRTFMDLRTMVDSSAEALATESCFYSNRSWVLVESSTIVGVSSSDTAAALIRVRGGTTDMDNLYLSNATLRCEGTTEKFFHRVSANNYVAARHSVFVTENSIPLFGGNTTDAGGAGYTISKCWYDTNISQFGAGVSYDTQAEWTSGIDANGNYGVDFSSEFVSSVTLKPRRYGQIDLTRDTAANASEPNGINGVKYRGNAGAWQLSKDTGYRGRGRAWHTERR